MEKGNPNTYPSAGDETLDDEQEDEEEEEQPILKFLPFNAAVLSDDANDMKIISCMAVSGRLLFTGTFNGHVHVMDSAAGNLIDTFRLQRSAINDIGVDVHGEFIVVGSADGTVTTIDLYKKSHATISFDQPVRTVALDPGYARKQSRPLVCGGSSGRVYYVCTTLLTKRRKISTLEDDHGAVRCIRWCHDLVAWATDFGIRIYDMTAKRRIMSAGHRRDHPGDGDFRCNLQWESDTALIMAWGSTVTLCRIKTRAQYERVQDPSLPPRVGDVVCSFTTDFLICGVAPYLDHLLLLTFTAPTTASAAEESPAPELRVLRRRGEEIGACALHWIQGYARAAVADYQLAHDWNADEGVFYVMSPRGIVVAQPSDDDDHVAWLLRVNRHREALDLVADPATLCYDPQHRPFEIGQKFLAHLVAKRRYAEAAALCPELLGRSSAAWESWFFRFLEHKQLHCLGPYLPAESSGFRLGRDLHGLFLTYLVRTDSQALLHFIEAWGTDLYDVQSVVEVLSHELSPQTGAPGLPFPGSKAALASALAVLCEHTRQYTRALHVYLRLRRPDVFEFIKKHDLFALVRDEVVPLLEVDAARAIELLVAHRGAVPIHDVVAQTERYPLFQHFYLDRLFRFDANGAVQFHDRQVELYAEYDPAFLLNFLRQSQYIDWARACRVCQAKGLTEATVFVMGRMGNTHAALAIIIRQLGDAREAVRFVLEHNDPSLFDDLVGYCRETPALIPGLLEHMLVCDGALVRLDPIQVLRAVPEGAVLPELQKTLVDLVTRNTMAKASKQTCLNLLNQNSAAQHRALHRQCAGGMAVRLGRSHRCAVCGRALRPQGLGPTMGELSGAQLLFQCGCAYHVECWQTLIKTTYTLQAEAPPKTMDPLMFAHTYGVAPHCVRCGTVQPMRKGRSSPSQAAAAKS